MVLKPQTMRNWKLATGIACTATGLHAVFNVDYGEQEHVFTGVRDLRPGLLYDRCSVVDCLVLY